MSTDITTLGMAVDSSGVRRATDDLDRMTAAGGRTAESATGVEKSMVGSVLAANQLDRAISSVVNTVTGAVSRFIDLGLAAGDYQDAAERIASDDPAGLASLRTAADVAGTSVDTVAGAINRMVQQMNRGGEDNAAKRALRSINIEIDDFKQLDPVEQYRTLAKALDGYADSQAKVRVLQAVTGRGGADQLVMMKELAGETERSNILTKEQIELADAVGDAIKRSRSELLQQSQSMSVEWLPAIQAINGAFVDLTRDMLGFDDEAEQLRNREHLRVWADKAVAVFGFVVDSGEGVIRVMRGINLTMNALTEMSNLPMFGGFKEAREIIKRLGSDLDDLLMERQFSDRLAEQLRKARETAARGGVDKPKIDDSDLDTPGKIKKVKDEYEELNSTLNVRLGIAKQEIELGRKLTEDEKLRIEVYEKVSSFKKLLKAEQLESIDAILEEIAATRELERESERLVTSFNAQYNARKEITAEQQRNAVSAERLAEASKDQLETYGKTDEELNALSVALLRYRASQLLAEKAIEEAKGETTAYTAALEQEADALLRAADNQEALNEAMRADREEPLRGAERAVRSYLERIKDAGTETERVVSNSIEGLEDVLVDLSTKGKSDIRGLIDYMIAEFLRLRLIRPILNEVFGGMDGSGGLGSLIGSLLGIFGFGSNTTDFRGTELPGSLRGGKASGGRVDPFTIQPVNERGPELLEIGGSTYLMSGGSVGNVIPNEKIGGTAISITSAPTIHIDARSDAAVVRAMVRAGVIEGNRALVEELEAQGR